MYFFNYDTIVFSWQWLAVFRHCHWLISASTGYFRQYREVLRLKYKTVFQLFTWVAVFGIRVAIK